MNSWKIFLLKHSPLQKNFKVSTVIGAKGSHWINYLMFGQPEYRRGIPHLQVSFVVGSGWCNRWAAGEKHRHRHYRQELDLSNFQCSECSYLGEGWHLGVPEADWEGGEADIGVPACVATMGPFWIWAPKSRYLRAHWYRDSQWVQHFFDQCFRLHISLCFYHQRLK